MYKAVDEALEEFFQDCRTGFSVQKKEEITIKNIAGTWRMFLRCNPIDHCSQITEATLRSFFAWGQEKRQWKPMTVRTHRKNISVFVHWALQKRYMRENPLRGIPKNRVMKRVPKHHTKAEIEAIYTAVDLTSKTYFERVRNKAIIAVAALAGLRRGEIVNLKLADVSFETNRMLVVAETSKSRKERWVPITQRLKMYLQEYLNQRDSIAEPGNPYLWVSSVTGKPFTHYGIRHLVSKLSDRTGFQVKMHSLRHSYGTFAYAGSKDIKAVQETMGHSDLSTTMMYVNSLSEDIHEAAEMSPLNML